MLTLLLYVLIVGLVAALLFLVASAVFGRGEELGPLPEGTTVTVLPAAGIRGADVRTLRFQQVFRGYKAGEVDWALSRLAARIDELETQLAQRHPPTGGEDPPPYGSAPQQPGPSGIGPETGPHRPAPNATSVGWPGTTPDFPAPFGTAPPGYGGLPGAPGIATPFPGTGYPPHPFATGNGFGPAPGTTASGPISQAAPGATVPASEPAVVPGPQIAQAPDTARNSPAESGYGPAAAGPRPAPGTPASSGFTAPVEAGATDSWAPAPLPSDPQPGPGGLQ